MGLRFGVPILDWLSVFCWARHALFLWKFIWCESTVPHSVILVEFGASPLRREIIFRITTYCVGSALWEITHQDVDGTCTVVPSFILLDGLNIKSTGRMEVLVCIGIWHYWLTFRYRLTSFLFTDSLWEPHLTSYLWRRKRYSERSERASVTNTVAPYGSTLPPLSPQSCLSIMSTFCRYETDVKFPNTNFSCSCCGVQTATL